MSGLLDRLAARGRVWLRWADFVLAKRFALPTREDRTFFLLIPTLGLLVGALGVLVHRLIDLVRVGLWGYWGTLVDAAESAPAWRVVLAPTIGGLLVGLLVWWAKESVGGRGMSSLIEAVALQGGKVATRPTLLSAAAAVATVGSGGSLGREGPLIRLGAAVSSALGQRLGLPAYRLKVLVGCGAAAGFAAAYNVPIGGSLFAMEVILGSFALEIFGPIVIAAVLSTLLARAAESNTPIYAVPGYALESPWEIGAYVGLGVVGAVASIVFVLGVRGVARLFQRIPGLPAWAKPPLGMALLGLYALAVPQALGSGFSTIGEALHGELPWRLLLLLPLAKLLATALTLGCGGAGGLFTPSLFFGAMVGGAYGVGVHAIFPSLTADYGAYAAVGMAAVAAGTSHAPLSAILMLFEFTGNYELILPLMVAAIVSSLLARRLYPFSIYTEPLQRRGVELSWRMEEAVLAGLSVGDLARPDPEVLRPSASYGDVVDRFLSTRRHRLFVVDDAGALVGSVSLHDIKHLLRGQEALPMVVAHDLATPVELRLRKSDRLHRAAELFARSDFERLPVVDLDGRKFLGILAKRDLLSVYAQEVLGRPAVLSTFARSDQTEPSAPLDLPPDFEVKTLSCPAVWIGRTLAELRTTQRFGVRVLEIRRRGAQGPEWVAPDARTVLLAGDELALLGPSEGIERLIAEPEAPSSPAPGTGP